MLSLSLVQQRILPKNWPFFRFRAYDHGNVLLTLYVNDYNYNKACLGTCNSRLVPLITQQQYISPREVVQNHSPWKDPLLSGQSCAEVISGCMPSERVWWNSYNHEVFYLSVISSQLRST